MNYENNSEINLLCEYLRIPSVQPQVDYDPCLSFLKRQAADLDVSFKVVCPARTNKPVIILTWQGLNPELPGIMFNSHMDVAEVVPDKWNYPPFSAHIDENGMIYGRGVQKSKAVGIQYLAAIRALMKDGFRGQRTAYVTFMPDEEVGSHTGMKYFVQTNFFRKMNVGFALDGGIACPENHILVFNGERIQFQATFTITGNFGEPSHLNRGSAGEKLNSIMKNIMDLRQRELRRLHQSDNIHLGDVVSINLTKVVTHDQACNLLSKIEASFDIRLPLRKDPKRFIEELHQWAAEAGSTVNISVANADLTNKVTPTDSSNQYWMTLQSVCEEEKITLKQQILPHASDNRFIRNIDIPALNLSFMPNTRNLSHNHNEHLSAEIFLKGIEFYTKLIPALLDTIPPKVTEPEEAN